MNRVSVVLVRPKYARNVGMVSRALSNFGVPRLILVDPRCELDDQAKQGAAQGQDPLTNVTIYSDWSQFYAQEAEGPRLAFSRRQGRRRPSLPWLKCLELDMIQSQQPAYLIFGAEDHGLSAEDLSGAHQTVYLDLPGSLHSMNLSHAVVMALTQLSPFVLPKAKLPSPESSQDHEAPIKDPEPMLRQWLEILNFDLETRTRWNALVMIKQIILRGIPSQQELQVLEKAIQQTIRRLKDKKSI
jgi:TrmH family RNA methyltransferase